MSTLTLEYTPELAAALGKRSGEAAQEIRLMAALKLFEEGRISSGLGAQLAGMERVQFLLRCGEHGVSVFQQTAEELESDAKAVRDARGG